MLGMEFLDLTSKVLSIFENGYIWALPILKTSLL